MVEHLDRRGFFARALGLGPLALAALRAEEQQQQQQQQGQRDPVAPKPPHFRARARAVIYLNMTGAPSQFDSFEHKPTLQRLSGQPIPESFLAGQRFAFIKPGEKPNLLASPWKLAQHGQTGAFVTELLPNIARIVDKLTFVRGMVTDEINHVPAQLFFETGSPRMGRPSMGSWVTYGLGSMAKDLPGFVVLASGKAGRCGTTCWGSGFLPSLYQGIALRSSEEAVLGLADAPGIDRALRRSTLDSLQALNAARMQEVRDPEIEARIAQYELAFRMQSAVPELMDIDKEPAAIHALYGTEPGKATFANHCLLARRLVERGVRFVELTHGGWDHHGGGDQNLVTDFPLRCSQIDRGTMALILDLESRGLLDDVLVIWGGEFGRTPMTQGKQDPKDLGRDHLKTAFTIFLAGGGIKPGTSLGETDELGMTVTKDKVHVHDLQATILHLLGLEHTKLVYRYQGRDFRLTDVAGEVVSALF